VTRAGGKERDGEASERDGEGHRWEFEIEREGRRRREKVCSGV